MNDKYQQNYQNEKALKYHDHKKTKEAKKGSKKGGKKKQPKMSQAK